MSGQWKGVLVSQGTIRACTFWSYCVSIGGWNTRLAWVYMQCWFYREAMSGDGWRTCKLRNIKCLYSLVLLCLV